MENIVIENLKKELNIEIDNIIKESTHLIPKSTPSFLKMREDYKNNPVLLAEQLMLSREIQSGFEKLCNKKRHDLTIEALIVKKKYQELFANNNSFTIRSAIKRLQAKEYNFPADSFCNLKDLKEYDKNQKQNKNNNQQSKGIESINVQSSKNEQLYEGNTKERTILYKERNQEVVKKVKANDGYTCQACNFNYQDKIVEAHHLIPLSNKNEEYEIKEKDLVTLCPNCHSLAHVLLNKSEIYEDKDTLIKELKRINQKKGI